MSSTPWQTDRWFVSPWNYAEEVTNGFHFPETIEIHDVSLRDGEQQAGLVFNKDDKIRIAEKLAEAGVHRIEAGMPAVSQQDEDAVREIVKRNLGPKTFAFARCMVEDVKKAVDCGVDGILVEIPSSMHIIQRAYKWPLEKAIEASIKATTYAREQGLYTVFFPIDCSRAELDWVLQLLKRVATEGHMDALAVVDTFGGTSPHAIPYLVNRIKREINKPLEAHFHDDFGMGAANTVMGLAAGCEVAHCTITGIGERAGNTAYEDVVMALLTMYGKDIGIRTEKLLEVSRTLQEISGIRVPANRGVVGESLFHIESGIISTWYKNCYDEYPTEIFPIHPELVGQAPGRVVLGKNSGADSVAIHLDRMGLSATDEQILEMVDRIKEEAFLRSRLITESEFRDIAESVLSGVESSAS